MDSQSVAFLEVMAAIGVVGLVAFLIFLVSRQAVRAGSDTVPYQPQWVELLLAAAAVLIVAILLIWQFPPWGGTGKESGDGRAAAFFVIMLIIGGAGLIVFLATMLWRTAQHAKVAPSAAGGAPTGAPTATPPEPTARHEIPSATRLLGLLGFGVAFLVLNWSYVPHGQQYTMMLHLIYPAGLVVALVMMFDKASRAWHVKQPGESLREWLFCNAVLLLYLIGYLNLLSASVDNYNAMFWDFLHVLGFMLVLWVVDRKTSRLRFLFAHAYLLALPILLLIWRNSQGVSTPEGVSWWSTIWPFFFLALVFLVLEIIVLIANRENTGQGAGTAKDIVFLILYVIILVAARPQAAG